MRSACFRRGACLVVVVLTACFKGGRVPEWPAPRAPGARGTGCPSPIAAGRLVACKATVVFVLCVVFL